MTSEQIIDVLNSYSEFLKKEGYMPVRDNDAKSKQPKLNHVSWMCEETKNFVKEGKDEKANRWLGFIQGVLWAYDIYTVDEMRNHNR